MANIVEQLSELTYGQIERMGERDLIQLLQKARRATAGRLATIEKHNYDQLVPNIDDLKKTPHISGMTPEKIRSEIRRRKSFLTGSRSSAKMIQAALNKGYRQAQNASGRLGGGLSLSSSTEVYDPKEITTVVTPKGKTVYRNKEGKAVKIRYTVDGQPIYVPVSSHDPAAFTKPELRRMYQIFKDVWNDPAIKAADMESIVVRTLVYYAQHGKIFAAQTTYTTKKGNTVKRLTTSGLGEALANVYDSYIQGTRDTKLADEAVYNALDKLL